MGAQDAPVAAEAHVPAQVGAVAAEDGQVPDHQVPADDGGGDEEDRGAEHARLPRRRACEQAADKESVSSLYDVTANKVNTLIRPDGKKKAYVHLTQNYDALDIANRIGII